MISTKNNDLSDLFWGEFGLPIDFLVEQVGIRKDIWIPINEFSIAMSEALAEPVIHELFT